MTLEETKAARFRFLEELYKQTGGNHLVWPVMFELGESLGFDHKLTSLIVQYLKGEHLLEPKTLGGHIGITHYGVKTVEQALSEPDEPTQYFPPVNVINNNIHIGSMVNSAVQQNSHGSHQTNQIGEPRIQALGEILNEIKRSIDQLGLDAEKQSDLRAEIETVEAQLKASKPKSTIIDECLRTIRNLVEGTAGGLASAGILAGLTRLLGG